MFNIGPGELVIIFVAALVLLGPERLPELARGIGKFLREFRRQTDDVRGMVEREFYRMDEQLKAPLPSPAPPGSALAAPSKEPSAGADPHLNDPMHGEPLLAAPPLPEVAAAEDVPLVLGFPEGTVARGGRPPAPAPAPETARKPGSEPHGG